MRVDVSDNPPDPTGRARFDDDIRTLNAAMGILNRRGQRDAAQTVGDALGQIVMDRVEAANAGTAPGNRLHRLA